MCDVLPFSGTIGEVDGQEEKVRTGGNRKRNERWLKTQSAYVTSSHSVTTPSPPPPPRKTTPTRDSAHQITRDQQQLAPPDAIAREEEEEVPALPPKTSHILKLGNEHSISANSRRLQAMNVTIRRPSESEGERSGHSGMKLSKEALLLRSGVTLRPGTRPPRPLSVGEEVDGGREVGGGASGSDQEDSLEPVTR